MAQRKPAPRPANQSAPRPSGKRNRNRQPQAPVVDQRLPSATLIAWISVGAVLLLVVGLVVVKITKSPATPASASSPNSASSSARVVEPLSAATVAAIADLPISPRPIPPSPVSDPAATAASTPTLTASVNGHALPEVFYYGAEWCPYCGAERWALASALSRFGTFSGLQSMYSSPTDYAPNTPTITFAHATYSSPYLAFSAVEAYTDTPAPGKTPPYVPLDHLNASQKKIIARYDKGKSFPFVDLANRYTQTGSAFDPSSLAGLTTDQVAAQLTTSLPAAQSIRAAANDLTAQLCVITHGQPGSVCQNKAIVALAKQLHLK